MVGLLVYVQFGREGGGGVLPYIIWLNWSVVRRSILIGSLNGPYFADYNISDVCAGIICLPLGTHSHFNVFQ